jgi:4-amino-4-deoxy-L-arabinose transferase-like glycosyltransferase
MLSLRRARVAMLVFYTLLALLFVYLVPPLEAPDESYHLEYINYVAARGELPNQYDPGSTVRIQGHQHPLYYLLTGLPLRAFAAEPRTRVTLPDNPAHVWHNGRQFGVPLYDHGAGPAFPSPADRDRFYALRLLSVAFGVANVWLVMRLAALFFPDTPWQLVPPLLVATLPQFVFVSAVVNNDPLANVLATAAIYLAFRVWQEPDRWPGYVGLGVALGLGILTKKTLLFLFPVTALMLAVIVWRRRAAGLGPALGRALLVPLAVLILTGWLFARNQVLYGELLGSEMEKRTLSQLVHEKPLWHPYLWQTLPRAFGLSFVGNFGWLNVFLPSPCYWFYAGLGLAAVVGLLRELIGRRLREPMMLFAGLFVLTALSGIVYYNLTFSQSQGRHIFPALSLVGVLTTVGLRAFLATIPLAPVRRLLLAAVLVAPFLIDAVSVQVVSAFFRAGPGTSQSASG